MVYVGCWCWKSERKVKYIEYLCDGSDARARLSLCSKILLDAPFFSDTQCSLSVFSVFLSVRRRARSASVFRFPVFLNR